MKGMSVGFSLFYRFYFPLVHFYDVGVFHTLPSFMASFPPVLARPGLGWLVWYHGLVGVHGGGRESPLSW